MDWKEMPSASFRFGANGQHEARIECGYFGRENYYVDGVLVRSHWSLWPNGERQFQFNGHRIEVRIRVGLTAVDSEAFVDDQLVASDLFADFNASLPKLDIDKVTASSTPAPAPVDRSGTPFMTKVGVWLALVLAIFLALKYFE